MTFQRSIKRSVLISFSALMLGCAQHKSMDMYNTSIQSDVPNAGLSKVPLNVGDVFTYDNPVERWEVAGIAGQSVQWRSPVGDYKGTGWSTLLPKLRWSNSATEGTRTLDNIVGSLHPLEKGKQMSFIENTVYSRPGSTSASRWSCEVVGQATIVVVAGKSDTWLVLCKVDGEERVLFNYAENIGNIVRAIYIKNDGTQVVRQLTAYTRGPKTN
ncbi:hypothetical protein TDB9533_03926 [Thalassocella blandensis]|nr:hypothetical protein TDB9533_03926 [Thalassocella blandensis]